jgi:hypothetical protein
MHESSWNLSLVQQTGYPGDGGVVGSALSHVLKCPFKKVFYLL